MKEIKKNTAVLILATVFYVFVYEVVLKGIVITKLETTYLFMLIYLCMSSILKE